MAIALRSISLSIPRNSSQPRRGGARSVSPFFRHPRPPPLLLRASSARSYANGSVRSRRDADPVEVIGIGSRKDAVIDFCSSSRSVSSSLVRFWTIYMRDSSKVQLLQRCHGTGGVFRDVEFPLSLHPCPSALILVASAGHGLDHITAIELLNAVKSAGGLTISIFLKPFSFEGQRRQEEADDLIKRLQDCSQLHIVVEADTLLKKEAVTLAEALESANNAVLLALTIISIMVCGSQLIYRDSPGEQMQPIKPPEVVKFLASCGEAKFGFGAGYNIKSAITQAVFHCPFLCDGIKELGTSHGDGKKMHPQSVVSLFESQWSSLQMVLLREILMSSARARDPLSAWSAAARLLRSFYPLITPAGQSGLASTLANSADRLPVGTRCADPALPFIRLHSFPLHPSQTDIIKRNPLKKKWWTGSAPSGPFIYTPFSKGGATDNSKEKITWVVGEPIQVLVELANPYSFDLVVESIYLSVHSGNFDAFPVSVNLPPNTAKVILLSEIPTKVGPISIPGCIVHCFGVITEHLVRDVDNLLLGAAQGLVLSDPFRCCGSGKLKSVSFPNLASLALSLDGGAAGALLRKLYLYNIDKMNNTALCLALKGLCNLKYVDFSTSLSIIGTFLRNFGSGADTFPLETLILRDCLHLKEVEVSQFFSAVLDGDCKQLRYVVILLREGCGALRSRHRSLRRRSGGRKGAQVCLPSEWATLHPGRFHGFNPKFLVLFI